MPSVCHPTQPRTEEAKTATAEETTTDTAEQGSTAAENGHPLSLLQATTNFSEAARQLMAVLSAGGHVEPGARVCVKGLQVSAQVNNYLGTAIEWSATQERWKVRLNDGRAVLIRPQNLEPCSFSAVVNLATTTTTSREEGGKGGS